MKNALGMRAVLLVLPLMATVYGDEGIWTGVARNGSLRSVVPKAGCITDADTWTLVWETWRPDQRVPEVDFEKEIVLVRTVSGPNRTAGKPTKDDEGNVTFRAISTLRGGPGFGYILAKISAEGVKTINGEPFFQGRRATVTGAFVIPKDVPSFAGRTVEIRLYKIHPLLADAPATLVDLVEIEDYAHTQDEESKTPFVIGGNEKLEPGSMYYVTLFILKDGKRTHMGKVPDKFLCKVLTNGEPSKIEMAVNPVR
jgi:hypothetical protein